MGKDGGFLTAKAIAKRIKAKGLQRLRWYCQACEKQCRDANGFKCHCESEAHNRQMQLLAQNARGAIDGFSAQFEKEFMRLVSQKYRSRKVRANVVYNEFIADRHHTHMNATMWTTLSEFIAYLGREGKVTVEETEKGLHFRYIDRDAIARNEAQAKKEKMDVDDEERTRRLIEEQKERAREAFSSAAIGTSDTTAPVELKKGEGEALGFALPTTVGMGRKKKSSGQAPSSSLFLDEEVEDEGHGTAQEDRTSGRKRSAATELMQEQERAKKRRLEISAAPAPAQKSGDSKGGSDAWLVRGIVVRILHKKIGGGKYKGKKAVVQRVVDTYGGELRLLDSGDVLVLDQQFLETVVPNVGGRVKVLAGEHRKRSARVTAVDVDRSVVDLELLESREQPRSLSLRKVSFDHVCKVHKERSR